MLDEVAKETLSNFLFFSRGSFRISEAHSQRRTVAQLASLELSCSRKTRKWPAVRPASRPASRPTVRRSFLGWHQEQHPDRQ